jgi:Peptidase family M48
VMARYGVIALLCSLYVAVSVWLIQSEGQAFREALGRSLPAETAVPAVVAGRPVEKPNLPVVDSAATSGASSPGTPGATARRVSEPPPRPSAAVAKAEAPAIPARTAGTLPVTAAPSGGAAKTAPRLEDLDPFWNQDYLTKSWDLDHFTAQSENLLGEQLHNLILQLTLGDTGPGRQRVIEATRQLVELRGRKDIEYKFTILNSDIPNAFSHPGGFIYVSRGLLDMIADDEDYALEFAVGHEMAHTELQHALKCLQDQRVRNFKDGTLQKLYFLIIPHAYPKELEFEADRWVYQRMERLGRTDHDCLGFLRKLESYAKANGFPDGQGKLEELYRQWGGKPGEAPAISPIENHLRAHTAAWDRLSQLKQFRDQAAKAPK